MISSQSVPLLVILASSLTLTCLSLIKSTLYRNLVIFMTSVEFVIFFLFLQPQLLLIHLSPANSTTAIHFTLASHKQISTNFETMPPHTHIPNKIPPWIQAVQTIENLMNLDQICPNKSCFQCRQTQSLSR